MNLKDGGRGGNCYLRLWVTIAGGVRVGKVGREPQELIGSFREIQAFCLGAGSHIDRDY